MSNYTKIPKIIHQIWIGYQEMPELYQEFTKQMKEMHPDWEYKLWTHDEVFNNVYKDDPFLQEYVTKPDVYRWAFISDRIRLLILRDYGGIYCDVDAKPIRPFDIILEKLNPTHTFFTGLKPLMLNNQECDCNINATIFDCTVYGSAPRSRAIMSFLEEYTDLYWAHGCKTFSDKLIMEMDTDIACFGHKYFYDNKITDSTIVLHDVEDRMLSWITDENKSVPW